MKNLLLFIPLFIIGFSSCKKEEVEPATYTPPNPNITYVGTVSGSINTQASDGTIENFSISFTQGAASLYNTSTNQLSFQLFKNSNSIFYNNTDFTDGYFTFNNSDSTRSAPTAWDVRINASNSTNSTIFFFRTNSIDQTNSSISNFTYNSSDNTVSFTLTTNVGYVSASTGKNTTIKVNYNIPLTQSKYRMASNN